MTRAPLAAAIVCVLVPRASAQVTTAQYDNARTGSDTVERHLTPRNVGPDGFGKLLTLSVEGDVYAQPLWLPHLSIPGNGVHDVLFVATEHDDVYAFDATGQSAAPLWHVAFAAPARGVLPVPSRDARCPFIRPDIGISATPVIDTTTGTLYVLARTKESDTRGTATYVQRLHALDVHTGAEKFGGPVVIQAAVRGTAGAAADGRVRFDPLTENPRSALLLTNGLVYLAWASSCDVAPYHGWVMTYDGRTLRQVGVLNTTPDGEAGGIWQGQAGLAADQEGQVFAVTGNGTFDGDVPERAARNYGNSVLRLGRDAAVHDYFTPFNQEALNAQDLDLGSGGPVLLPPQPGRYPHLLVVGGKGGGLYVVNRDSMGRFHPGDNRHAVQVIETGRSCFGAVAYWSHHVFAWSADDVLRDYLVEGDSLRPVGRGTVQLIDPGATPTISANGARDGIVWVIASKGWRAADQPAVLHAFDASNVARELYTSEQHASRDRAGMTLRFSIPTVADGRVYVGTKGGIEVYGLLPTRARP